MDELHTFLRQFPFFHDVEDEDLEKIAPLFITRVYDKGKNVFLEGEQGDELFIIKTGIVRIYRVDDSREIILAIFRDGDFFGEMSVLENEQVRSASAKTMEKTTLYVLKRRDFVSLLKQSPNISMRILETTLDRLRKANELITDLTILDARTRIVRVMLRLSETYGSSVDEGILIDLKLTHQQIADMTGTVRETVTKILLELQNQQLIQIDKKRIILCNLPELERVVGA